MSEEEIKLKKEEMLAMLGAYYGFAEFRPGQEQAIENVLAGHDTLVIMPTGGGKSLVYQLPALAMPGVTIVVSPLISLMKDQVDSLLKLHIPASYINSSLSEAELKNRLNEIKDGKYKLVYVAPERFYDQSFLNALSEIKVSLFAIDEAHCISQWGHDFRPSYAKLGKVAESLGRPPIIALTATATPEVRDDIIAQLNLKNYLTIITGFARPNIQFGVVRASDREKVEFINQALASVPDGSGIIYAGTRSKADEIAQSLIENDIEAVVYHAGMDAEDRKWVQENFMSGKARVIVATNAFGMGIDKSNIRFVIHCGMPGTIEAYYQEAGRAGRDGQPSFCILLYSPQDRYLREFFIKGDNPPSDMILDVYDIITNYESDKVLVTYSELKSLAGAEVPEMAIGTALKVLEKEGYLSRAKEKQGSSRLKFVKEFSDILGSLSNRAKKQIEILQKIYDMYGKDLREGVEINLEDFAGQHNMKKESVAAALRRLTESKLIEYIPPFKGTEINILKRVPRGEVKLDFSALKNKLDRAQEKLDKMEEYVYHFGCRQGFILDYFGDKDFKRCGKCDNCLSVGTYSQARPTKSKKEFSKQDFTPRESGLKEVSQDTAGLITKLTQLQTFDLYNQGLSIEEIAQERSFAVNTIMDHICYLIEKKLIKDTSRLLDSKREKKITEVVKKIGATKLTPIKEELGDDYSWEEIKITLAIIKAQK